jgi:hypothetical protein
MNRRESGKAAYLIRKRKKHDRYANNDKSYGTGFHYLLPLNELKPRFS